MVVISRRLPQTDENRQRATNGAVVQMGRVAPENMALTETTQTRVTDANTTFNAVLLAVSVALANQGVSTPLNEAARDKARMFISHFFQVFFLGVDRGVYPAAAKSFYGLDITANAVPSLDSEAAIREWGAKIKTGDVARMLVSGAVAMSNPSTAQVNTVVDAFITVNNAYSLLKAAYDTAQEDVEAQRVPVDKVIKKAWDETETFFDENDAESLRRKARPWGVIYISSATYVIHVHVQSGADSRAIAGANVSVVESNNNSITDAAGNDTVSTSVADEATIRVEAPGFVAQEIVVTYETDVFEYNMVFDMIPV